MPVHRLNRPDPHLVLALMAAVPVWVGLLMWAGPWMRVPQGVWAWCSLLLVQPCLEEWVFRGLLQGEALRLTTWRGRPARLGPVTWANALVTLAFVALHLLTTPVAWPWPWRRPRWCWVICVSGSTACGWLCGFTPYTTWASA